MLQMSTIAASIALAACAGNGEGLDAGGRPIGDGSGGGPLTADFASIQEYVHADLYRLPRRKCAGWLPIRQQLRPAVGIKSNEVSSIQREPGDPDTAISSRSWVGRASVGAHAIWRPYLDQATMT
jgi:hypothetical protein